MRDVVVCLCTRNCYHAGNENNNNNINSSSSTLTAPKINKMGKLLWSKWRRYQRQNETASWTLKRRRKKQFYSYAPSCTKNDIVSSGASSFSISFSYSSVDVFSDAGSIFKLASYRSTNANTVLCNLGHTAFVYPINSVTHMWWRRYVRVYTYNVYIIFSSPHNSNNSYSFVHSRFLLFIPVECSPCD